MSTTGDALMRLGLGPDPGPRLRALQAGGLLPARVARVDRGGLLVLGPAPVAGDPPRALRAHVAGRLRPPQAEAIAVGDWVGLRAGPGGALVVERIASRWSALRRRDPSAPSTAQVVAANLDVVAVVHGLDRPPSPRRLEREVALAWDAGARPLVVLTKADLAGDAAGAVRTMAAAAPGVDVLVVSGVTGAGTDGLHAAVAGHGTLALIGPSGAGKSTLANRLLGADALATGSVRAADLRGRHTTAARHLFVLPVSGLLVDTPGLREVGLWDDSGVERTFPEISELAAGCRFRDCTHVSEPDCAVRAGVAIGEVDEHRLAAYRKLQRELARLEAARDVHARLERRRAERAMAREIRRFRNR